MSVDPLTGSYPFITPYQFAECTPIQAIDIDGLERGYPINNVWIPSSDHLQHTPPPGVYPDEGSYEESLKRSEESFEAALDVASAIPATETVADATATVYYTKKYLRTGDRNDLVNAFISGAGLAIPFVGAAYLRWGEKAVVSRFLGRTISEGTNEILGAIRRYTDNGAPIGPKTLNETKKYKRDDVIKAGEEWVGEGYTIQKNAKNEPIAYISKDGIKKFRLPQFKKNRGVWQANFELKFNHSKTWDELKKEGVEATNNQIVNIHINVE